MLSLEQRSQRYGEAGRGWPRPPNSPAAVAVTGVGVAGAGAVAGAAAVGTEASSQGGSGHSGALPRRACRGSPRCWGHRRCGGPGGARPIPRGGRSKLQGRDTVRDGASVSAQALHHKGAGDACKTASKPRDTSGVSVLFFPSPI